MNDSPETRTAEADCHEALAQSGLVSACSPERSSAWQHLWLWAVFAVAAAAIGYLLVGVFVGNPTSDDALASQTLILHRVTRSDFAVTVTERGDLESQTNLAIVCEVDDVPGDSIYGTPIIWIIPNGSCVDQGALLVELDSSHHKERLDRQILAIVQARSAQVQVQASYEAMLPRNEMMEVEAKLKVHLSDLALRMFKDPDSGTHRLEVVALERRIEEINNEVLAAETAFQLAKQDLELAEKAAREQMTADGEIPIDSRRDIDRRRLKYLKAEEQYAKKINELKTATTSLEKKKSYEKEMKTWELQREVDNSQRQLIQLTRDNEAKLAQTKAALTAANECLNKHDELLARYRQQIEKCRVFAPTSGFVVYSRSEHDRRSRIRPGYVVRHRERILSFPELQSMQVEIHIRQDLFDQVKIGLPVSIRVVAFPERSYQGSVQSVAALPTQAVSGSAHGTYRVVVSIDEDVADLVPGMSAVTENQVALLQDVLTVPVEAVVNQHDGTWCYVDAVNGAERRPVKVGRRSGGCVEICEGLVEGERVVIKPMQSGRE